MYSKDIRSESKMVYVNPEYADRVLRSDSEAWLLEDKLLIAKSEIEKAKEIQKVRNHVQSSRD